MKRFLLLTGLLALLLCSCHSSKQVVSENAEEKFSTEVSKVKELSSDSTYKSWFSSLRADSLIICFERKYAPVDSFTGMSQLLQERVCLRASGVKRDRQQSEGSTSKYAVETEDSVADSTRSFANEYQQSDTVMVTKPPDMTWVLVCAVIGILLTAGILWRYRQNKT